MNLMFLDRDLEPELYTDDCDDVFCWSDCDFEPLDTEFFELIHCYYYETRMVMNDRTDRLPFGPTRAFDLNTCPRVYTDRETNWSNGEFAKPYLYALPK